MLDSELKISGIREGGTPVAHDLEDSGRNDPADVGHAGVRTDQAGKAFSMSLTDLMRTNWMPHLTAAVLAVS